MSDLGLFPSSPLAGRLGALAEEGILFGTSSWKYPGWIGDIYNRDRYVWRGRFSKARFERLCLREYAETFKTVCVDAAYYTFPTRQGLEQMASMVPEGFRFGFKVTGDITIRRFPALPRFGPKGGRDNANFLNGRLFEEAFLGPCSVLGVRLGVMMFEFSRFAPGDFRDPFVFIDRLEGFLEELPRGHHYAVEIRNAEFLVPRYFEMLSRQGVAHVYNSWSDMPSVPEQLAMVEPPVDAPCVAARFLLRPGRTYADAVKQFSPYTRVQDPNEEAVVAGARLARPGGKARGKATPAFIYVNNRFEGNAPGTVRRMIGAMEAGG